MRKITFLFILIFLMIPSLIVFANGSTETNNHSNDERLVNVQLIGLENISNFEINNDYILTNNDNTQVMTDSVSLNRGKYEILRNKNELSIIDNLGKVLFSGNDLTLSPKEYSLDSLIRLGNVDYLGDIVFTHNSIHNVLPMEHYLYGVVPSEMLESWPIEALKAQAISARTFANTKTSTSNTVSDQVYKGYNPNNVNSINAVNSTKGTVLLSSGNLAEIQYSSSNGGYIKSQKNIYGTNNPHSYLTFKQDRYDGVNSDYNIDNNHKEWEFVVPADLNNDDYPNQTLYNHILNEIVKQDKTVDKKQIKPMNIKSLEFIELNNGTLKNINEDTILEGSIEVEYGIINENRKDNDLDKDKDGLETKSITINKRSYQFYLDKFFGISEENSNWPTLRSPNIIKVTYDEEDNSYVVTGSGFGHGIGMSQYGAKNMAEDGKTYKDILNHYYPNTDLYTYEVNDDRTPSKPGNEEKENNEDDTESTNNNDDNKKNPNENHSEVYHLIVAGDTLWSISAKYKISVEELMELNKLESNLIIVGDKLIIGYNQSSVPDASTPEKPKPNKPSKPDINLVTHTVVNGDTLWSISRSYNLTVNKLMSLNKLNSTIIHKGDKLIVSDKMNNGTNPPPENDNTNTKTSMYTVKKGDTLWSISRKYKVPIDQIKKMNNLKSDIIQIGIKLKLDQQIDDKNNEGNTNSNQYIVKKGDTLWAISNKINVSLNHLMNSNGLKGSLIHIGQILKY